MGWDRGSLLGRVGVSGKKRKREGERTKRPGTSLYGTFWFACGGRQRKTETQQLCHPESTSADSIQACARCECDSSGGSHKNRADGTLRIRACCARKLNKG